MTTSRPSVCAMQGLGLDRWDYELGKKKILIASSVRRLTTQGSPIGSKDYISPQP